MGMGGGKAGGMSQKQQDFAATPAPVYSNAQADADAKEAAAKAAKAVSLMKGRQSTILTDAKNDLGQPSTGRATLSGA